MSLTTKTYQPPGLMAGLKAIDLWLKDIYPEEVFLPDGYPGEFLQGDRDKGVNIINALRWAIERADVPDDTEPAFFYEEISTK